MDLALSIFAYVTTNGAQIGQALLAIHVAAQLVVNLTPTPKDDEIVAGLYRYVEFAAGIITPKAKQ